MIFRETDIPGVWLIETEPYEDERGSFARTFCAREFAARGLDPRVVQCNVSRNRRAGTLRGMHCQRPPHAEAKLVRCSLGRLYDVALDLRPGSPTRGKHVGVELAAGDGRLLYLPAGVHHGFLTLADETEIVYQMSEYYAPEAAHAVRWNDPAFGIVWPAEVREISERDASLPDYAPEAMR